MLFTGVFICVCYLGYLAQTTGLCMVRGVNEWKSGNKEYLLAILFSGVLVWVATIFAQLADIPVSFRTYQMSYWFLLGGFLFGLGTALNKGCGISTLGRLTRGDSKMIASIIGWLVGWVLLAYCSPGLDITRKPVPSSINYLLLITISIIMIIWVSFGNKKRKKLWFGMMGIGLLAGFIYLYQPKWPPSGLLNHLSHVLMTDSINNWPSLEQYTLIIALLLGMLIAAWHTNKFLFVSSNLKNWITHLFAGTLMGIGASLAMGGNSVQLLLALPLFSPAGFISIVGILGGIWSGLYIRKYFSVFN